MSNQYTSESPQQKLARFWSRIRRSDNPDECWEWFGMINSRGYGTLKYCGQTTVAHRVAWRITYGEIPDGLYACHKCDNRLCCNPNHLFLGTPLDNARDRRQKNRDGNHKGVASGQAKLNDEAVREIRKQRAQGVKLDTLAQLYGVSHAAVWNVVNGRSWTHVPYE